MYNIDRIIDEHGKKIYRYCYGMLRNRQDAEDAVQEIFIKVFKHIDMMNEIQSVSSWLYKVAYNHCLNIINKNKLLFLLPLKEDTKIEGAYYDLTLEQNEFSEQFTEIISRLSAADRSILILRVVEEKSYEEIAEIFNKHPDAIRKQYERARKKVKAYLGIKEGVKASEEVSIL